MLYTDVVLSQFGPRDKGLGVGHLEASWPEAGCECNVFVKPSSDGAGEEEAANGESLWEGTSCENILSFCESQLPCGEGESR